MDYISFLQKAKSYPLFKVADVFKWFPRANKRTVLNQLHLWAKKGRVERVRKGIYKLPDCEIKDSFTLASFLYSPSYISLESALNSAGIIPDIPFATTSVCLGKTQTFDTTSYGRFFYHHIKVDLFFCFETITAESHYSYNLATPEKALFDYFYLKAGTSGNTKGFIREMRLSLPKDFAYKSIKEWGMFVSPRNKSFHDVINVFLKMYAK